MRHVVEVIAARAQQVPTQSGYVGVWNASPEVRQNLQLRNPCAEFAIEQIGCGASMVLPSLVDGEVLRLSFGRDDSRCHLLPRARREHLSDRAAASALN
jgi:hypothetical protein